MQSLFNSIYRYLLRQRRGRQTGAFWSAARVITAQPPGTAPKTASSPVPFLPEIHGITSSPGETPSPRRRQS